MAPIDIVAVKHEAHRLRAEEIARIDRMLEERLGNGLRLLGAGLLKLGHMVSEGLRPLFSWNPQDRRS